MVFSTHTIVGPSFLSADFWPEEDLVGLLICLYPLKLDVLRKKRVRCSLKWQATLVFYLEISFEIRPFLTAKPQRIRERVGIYIC